MERFACHAFLGNLGMSSAPCGLCALERLVCCATLSYPGLSPAPQGLCTAEACMLPLLRQPAHLLCCGTSMASLSSLKSAVWSGLQSEHLHGLRIAAFSAFCPLSPCFAQFSEIPPRSPLGPACEGASQCMGTLPVCTSLSWDTCSCPEVLCLFPFYVSILSPTPRFRELLACPSWRPGVFCCHPEAALYLDEFF